MTTHAFGFRGLVGAVTCASILASHTLYAQEDARLTVAQAVAEALEHNDRLLNQADVTTQAELSLRLARDAYRPKVTPNVLGSFGQTNVSSQTYGVDVSQRFTTGTQLRLGVAASSAQIPSVSGAPDIRFYNADTTITVGQPLLRGFGRDVARRPLTSAEVRTEDAARQRAIAEQQVAVDVASAYYRVVAQQSFVAVTRQALDRARRLRDASEAKLDAGLVSQLDVLRAQQLVTQAEMQYFDAQASVQDGRDQLRFLMGRPSEGSLELDVDIPRPDSTPLDASVAAALALRYRPDLQSRVALVADADRQVRFSRNQLLPQVDVNLALTRRETSQSLLRSVGLDGFQFATFFTIAMPVDRTATHIDFQNSVIDRDRRRRELTTFERQVADEVKRSVRDRERTLRVLAAADASVAIARQEVDVAQLRFERGLSNNLDVVAAEASLLQAETQRIQAMADSAVGRLRLRATIGVFDPRTDLGHTAVLTASERGL